jgi:hypothetical protein
MVSAAAASLGATPADAGADTNLHLPEVEPELWFGQGALSADPLEEAMPEATAWHSLIDYSYFHRDLVWRGKVDDR